MSDRRRGHTLFELLTATSLMALIAGAVFTLAHDSQSIFGNSLRTVRASRACDDALKRVHDDVELADATALSITNASADGDLIQLKLPIGIAGETVTWGGHRLVDGVGTDYAGATVQYVVVATGGAKSRLQLMRRIVDAAGLPLAADELIADNVDEPDATRGKGFAVARNGRLVTITVRVRLSRDADRTDRGEDLIRSQQITVRLRNP